MFNIGIENFTQDLSELFFTAQNIQPIVFRVTTNNLNDWELLYKFKIKFNNRYYQPLPYQDISQYERLYVFYVDNIVRGYLDKPEDFNQTNDTEVYVTNIYKKFDMVSAIYKYENNVDTLYSNVLENDINYVNSAQQFGERGYIVTSPEILQFASGDPTAEYKTPKYNFSIYTAVDNIPFYIYFVIDSYLSNYYDFVIDDSFTNYLMLDDEYEILTDHTGVYLK